MPIGVLSSYVIKKREPPIAGSPLLLFFYFIVEIIAQELSGD